MELRHLEYFLAVAEELNFGRAAARLNITQPPLSQQIQQLEKEIGVTLFARTNRRVQLTHAGELFLAEVRQVLADLSHAVETAQRAHRGEVGSLAVGFVGSATYDILPSVLREYRQRFPAVQVTLYEMSTPAQVEALRQGRIDVGMLRPPVPGAALCTEIVQSAPCVLAVPQSHPLLDKREPIELADLAEHPFVALSRTTWAGLYDQILRLCQQAGFDPIIRQEAYEFQTVIGLVAGGMGVAVVPISAMNLHTQEVVYRTVPGLPVASMGISWQKENNSPLVRAFVQIANEIGQAK